MTRPLENGDVTFLIWPARGEQEVEGPEDVQRFFLVLRPEGEDRVRRLVVGQKKLPDGSSRHWGFVDLVVRGHDADRAYRRGDDADLAGPPARAAARGRYAIVRHDGHTDLVYEIEGEEASREALEGLHVEGRASFLLAIKNPTIGSPAGAGLGRGERASFPQDLLERFGDRRWSDADPPAFLDHEHAEFLLVADDHGAPRDDETPGALGR